MATFTEIRILGTFGVTAENVVRIVEDHVASTGHPRTANDVPHTPRAKNLLETALSMAKEAERHCGVEHVLLALLRDQEAISAQLLAKFGVDYEKVREVVAEDR